MEKGQTSAELLIILSVSLVAILAIFSLSNQSISDLNKQKLSEQAQSEVNELRDAVNDVYAQGVGARKKVLFNVPNGVDSSQSGIQNNSFVLNLFGSDIFARTDVTVTGTLPTEIGGHEIFVTAFENYVAIGSQNISVDKTSSFVTLSQSDSKVDNITITNSSSTDTNITIVTNWPNPDVTLTLSSGFFQLNSGQEQIVTLSFVSNASASGNYVGSLNIEADFTSGNENINLPINAEVSAPVGGDTLVILPLSKTIDLDAGASDTNSFQICNNTASALNNIDFTDSGTIADWIDPITSISSLASGECQTVSFTTNVPGGQGTGAYNGTITATDDSGTGSNTDSISITINVTSFVPGVPTLGNVDVVFFSDAGYSANSQNFQQGDTVYYEIRTFDINSSIIEVTDLNTFLTDPNPIVQQTLIGLSTTLGVYQGSYNLGGSATTGTWILQADANRNSIVIDSNTFTVTTAGACANQAACFSHSWNSSVFTCVTSGNPNNRYCQLSATAPFWTIQNTSSGTTITITRIMLTWAGDTDGDADVDVIQIDNVQRNTASSVSGAWNDITDFSVSAGTSITANNWLRWQGSAATARMDNETETYTLQFEFSDASTFTTTAYNPV